MDAIQIRDAIRQIWGSDSYQISVSLDVCGRFYAECETTYQRRRLTEKSYIETLNDMFCDYCTEKATMFAGAWGPEED